MKSTVWKLQATASCALILSVGALFAVAILARGLHQRPALSCEVKAGEILVVLVSADGISLTKPCNTAGGRTK